MCRITRRTFRACNRTARRYSLGVTRTGWRVAAGLGNWEADGSLTRPGSMDTTRSVRDRRWQETGTATTRGEAVRPWPLPSPHHGEPPPRTENRLSPTKPGLPCWRSRPSQPHPVQRPRPSPPHQPLRSPVPAERHRRPTGPATRWPLRSRPRYPLPIPRSIPVRAQRCSLFTSRGSSR